MFKRKEHKKALEIARQYGLENDYLVARKWGLSPAMALEEFDIYLHDPPHIDARHGALSGKKVYASSRMCTDGRSPQRYLQE